MSGLLDQYLSALDAAPTLTVSPDLVTSAAQTQDPAQTAQVLDQSQTAAATTNAVVHHEVHHPGLLSGLFSAVGSAASAVGNVVSAGLNYLSKPLGEVQHDYRFVHDLWAKGDPLTATLGTLGIIGGGVGGGMVGGGFGAALGADAVAEVLGRGADAGLLGQSNQGLYQQSTGEKISPGRDLTNLLGNIPGVNLNTDSGVGKFVSGTADAAFDFAADPLIKLGDLAAARRTLTGLTETYAARNVPAVRQVMLDHGFGGLGAVDSADGGIGALDRMQAARQSNPQYNRALGAIADSALAAGNEPAKVAGSIVSNFPDLQRMAGPIATAVGKLGADVSRDQVAEAIHQQFMLSASNAEMLGNGYGILPSRTLLRQALAPIPQALKNISPVAADSQLDADALRAGNTQTGGLLSALNPKSDVTLTGALAQKVRTFSGYMPFTIDRSVKEDKELLDLSTKTFDPLDPGSLRGVYNSMRFSLGEQGAQSVVGDMAIAQQAKDLDQLKVAYANGYKKMLVAAGLPDDHPLVKSVSDAIDAATDDLKARQYGYGRVRGSEVNSVPLATPARVTDLTDSPTTVTADMGLWDHQTGQFSYPNFWAIKNSVRAMTNAGNAYGSVDQFLADHYTNAIFKPLALVNAGFGLRVAAAEALPAAFRYGALNMLQNRVAASAAKSNYKLDGGNRLLDQANAARESGDMQSFTDLTQQAQDFQVGHLTAAVGHLVGGMSKLLHLSDEDTDLATHIVAVGKGDAVWGVGRAGEQQHRLPINSADRANAGLWYSANERVGARATGNYTLFTPNTEQFADMWHGQLSKLAYDESAQNIAQDLLTAHRDGLNLDDAAHRAVGRESNRIQGFHPTGTATPVPDYQKGRAILARYTAQDPTAFAADRVDSLQNLLTGQDGTFHADLAQKVANGEAPDLSDITAKPLEQAPSHVPGMQTVPYIGPNLLNRVVSEGFQRVVDPIINYLSREPLFFAGVKEQMPALQSMVDRGLIDQDDAYREAFYRATEGMLPQIHNVQLRSQFAEMSRNLLPFYFAQEQSVRRNAYLIGKDPGALRQYNMVANSLTDPNFIHTDANGNRSLLIPGSNVLGPFFINAASTMGLPLQSGLPLSFTGSMSSLSTVLPEMKTPGVTPLVSVPLNEMAKFFPEWSPAVKAVVGDQGFGQSLHNAIIPNAFLRNATTALTGPEQDRGFANAFSSALSAAAAHGELPGPNATPAETQAFIDRVKNNTRSIFMMKAVLSAFSPLSPQPTAEDFGWRDEFYNLTKTMTYPQAVNQFIKEHGSNAVSYTIAKTANSTGAYIPSTVAAEQFINDNQQLIKDHMSAAYFVPENASAPGDQQVIHNELVNMGLRGKETPQDFLNQMYIKAGNTQYRVDKAVHDQQLAQLTDPADITAEKAAFAAHVEGLKKANVIWAQDFTSEERNLRATELFADMTRLFASGKAPDSPQTAPIKSLLDDAQTHLSALQALPSSQAFGHDRTVEKDAWQTYLASEEKTHPELANVIDSVFKRLDARL